MHEHQSDGRGNFDYGLMGDLSNLCNMVVAYVDRNKNIIRSEIKTIQINDLAGDIIQSMKRVIQARLNMTKSMFDEHEQYSFKEDEIQLKLNGVRLCNQYKRFNAWVDVYRHLTN